MGAITCASWAVAAFAQSVIGDMGAVTKSMWAIVAYAWAAIGAMWDFATSVWTIAAPIQTISDSVGATTDDIGDVAVSVWTS